MEKSELVQLADRVGTSTDRLVNTGNDLIKAINESSTSRDRHNKAILWLTAAIAVATIVYAVVTLWSTVP